MAEAQDLRIDATGTAHAVGRRASQELRARAGEWRLLPSPAGILLAMKAGEALRPLRLAGEVRAPGALCDVVSTIAQGAYTGELTAYEDDSVRAIHFDHGNVVWASSSVEVERLGEFLWRFGAITRGQLDEVLTAAEKSGKRVGEAAIELDFVQPEELFLMMGRQVEEIFYSVVQLDQATFFFFDGLDETKIARRLHLGTGQLLMEAARRVDELRFFREKIPSDGWVPVPLASPPGRKAPLELMEVLAQCDGRRSIAEIGRRTGQLEFEVTRAVFQLTVAGMVGVAPPRPEGPAAIVQAFDRALVEIHRSCDAAGTGKDLRGAVEQFAMSTGMFVPLLEGAGPLEDGSLRAERVAHNLAVLAADADPAGWLTQQLFEYVSFALFQAGSLLARDQETSLNARIAELLEPLRQQPEGGPPSSMISATSGHVPARAVPLPSGRDPMESR
jgi:hypothetical protein